VIDCSSVLPAGPVTGRLTRVVYHADGSSGQTDKIRLEDTAAYLV
jgi:hypothetical protein